MGIEMIGPWTSGNGNGHKKVGAVLIGAKNGVNRTFATPDLFSHGGNGDTIEVFHNGRRLLQATAPSPALGEYVPAESVLGGGYDRVIMVAFSPVPHSELVANYTLA